MAEAKRHIEASTQLPGREAISAALLAEEDPLVEALIAKALNLSRADVHGVVSFYHDFHDHADTRPEVQICRAEACQARGVEALIPGAEKAAGERVKLTTVYCLGLCSAGPSARVGNRLHARLDAKGLTQVIENAS